jgi:hypothetical protein
LRTYLLSSFSQEEQYASWMAACRLASKGRTLADSSYEAERKSILSFLTMQKPAPTPAISPASLDICAEDYVSSRYIKKLRSKVRHRSNTVALKS